MIQTCLISLVTWTSPVWKPSDGSNCTLSLCRATTTVHTSTLCTGWGNYHKGLPGCSDTSSEQYQLFFSEKIKY